MPIPPVLAPNQECAAILDQPSHVLGKYESFREETQDPERGEKLTRSIITEPAPSTSKTC
jgi:hypothetical protein